MFTMCERDRGLSECTWTNTDNESPPDPDSVWRDRSLRYISYISHQFRSLSGSFPFRPGKYFGHYPILNSREPTGVQPSCVLLKEEDREPETKVLLPLHLLTRRSFLEYKSTQGHWDGRPTEQDMTTWTVLDVPSNRTFTSLTNVQIPTVHLDFDGVCHWLYSVYESFTVRGEEGR